MTKLWAVLLIAASFLLVVPVLGTLTSSAPPPLNMNFWMADGGGGGACNKPSMPVDPEIGKPSMDIKGLAPRFQVIGTAEGGGGGAG